MSISALVLRVYLSGETFRTPVVFDAKCHLMRIVIFKEFLVKLAISRFVLWFECFHIGVIEHGAHSIANCVVSCNFIVAQTANKKVVSKEIYALELAFEVGDLASFSLDIFKDYSFSG